ncbi:MAG: SDR family oxidoreductase, partial [Gemmatimonadales bacterium]
FALEGLSEGLAQELKPFNIRVAVVQPGIIDTPAARLIADYHSHSSYPHEQRFAALFTASLQTERPASTVGQTILDIAESGTSQLRHPAGPDGAAFLEWRKSLNDEEWIAWGALDDDAWYQRMKQDFGMDLRRLAPTA